MMLWGCYIALSAWWSKRRRDAEANEFVIVFTTVSVLGLVPCLFSIGLAMFTKMPTEALAAARCGKNVQEWEEERSSSKEAGTETQPERFTPRDMDDSTTALKGDDGAEQPLE